MLEGMFLTPHPSICSGRDLGHLMAMGTTPVHPWLTTRKHFARLGHFVRTEPIHAEKQLCLAQQVIDVYCL